MAHIRRWHRLGLCERAVVEFGGKPIRRVAKAFAKVAREAGFDDVTPHTLRHTAVTWAMQGGADLWDAAAMFGMTVETLERVYGHHRPGAGASVARALQSKAAG
jgi:integrase